MNELPLCRLSAGQISMAAAIGVRNVICRSTRGGFGEIGPRWRIGTNNPWGPAEATLGSSAACPHCGADGGELRSNLGREFCPCCREEWVVGDYDWTSFTDVRSYRADREAGRVQDEEPNGWAGDGWAVFGLHLRVDHP